MSTGLDAGVKEEAANMSHDHDGVKDVQETVPDDENDEDRVSGEIVHIKNQRAGYKSVITRKRNQARASMLSETNPDVIKSMLPSMKEAWKKFEECHHRLISLLTSQDELSEAEKYYIDELDAEENMMERIYKWIETAKMQQAYDALGDSASHISARSTRSDRSSKSSSSTRAKQIEAMANRKALEAKFKVLEEKQFLVEQRMRIQKQLQEEEFRLHQEEQLMQAKAEIAEAKAREDVFTQSCSGSIVSGEHIAVKSLSDIVLPKKPETSHMMHKQPLNPLATEGDDTMNVYAQQFIPKTSDDLMLSMMTLMSKQQQQSSAALTLPKPEVPVYSGDPLEYCNFVRSFENLIEAKTDSASSRLHYLVQYTSGDVQELMRSCLSMEALEGYCEARKLLKKRYGQNYRIATAYVDRITKGPAIKTEDRNALMKYSVLLTSCKNTLANIGYLSKIENPDSLRLLINRLPYDMRKRWRVSADRISECEDREIKFVDIVLFVEREARASSHPIFGDISGPSTPHTEQKSSKATRLSFATNADSRFMDNEATSNVITHEQPNIYTHTSSSSDANNQPHVFVTRNCVVCDVPQHSIENCDKFKSMNMSSRIEFVQHKGLCFNCLIPRHRSKDCRKWSRCTLCKGKHSTLLHKEPDTTVEDAKVVHVGAVVGETDGMANPSSDNEIIALPIVPVKVRAVGGELIVTHAFLDPGSNMTFCSQSLKEQLGKDGKKSTCFLSTLNESNRLVEDDIISLQISDINEELTDFMELRSVLCRPALPVSKNDIPTQNDVDRWPYLQGLRVPDLNVPVGLLIGNDNASIIEPIDVIRSQHGGPCAVKTILGWSINGPLGRQTHTKNYTVNFIRGDVELSQQFNDFCNHEFNDSLADVSTKMSYNDAKALKIMEGTTQLTDDAHYEMELPLKNVPTCLPDNRMLANHRMNLLKKRLVKNKDLHKKYSRYMKDLFDKGFAEEIPIYSVNRSDGMVWYLPHHNVIHPMKPEKVRIVFDCSASYRGVSLNDILLQGPDFTNMLTGVLMRFRMEPIALMADVEGMFHQVQVVENQRDLLRFLWWRDGNLDQDPEVFRMKVHIFGATSSPSCCSYALRRAAIDNDDFDDITRKTVNDNFYVDDCLTSVKDERVAIRLANQLTQLLARGGFHLTKWSSNSARVIESIPPEDRTVGLNELDISNLSNVKIERALGVQWNVFSDQFKFNVIINEKPVTRRGILSIMSSIYDPLGFVAPILLPVKTILQDLCRQGLKWDDPIPEECRSKWEKWILELPKLKEFYIDRCVKKKNMDNIVSCELHHFCDASTAGYGAVVYLRLVDSSTKIHCAFLIGKSRVAPLKVISIPRLELSAATLSVRLDDMVRRELDLPLSKSVFWTDSTSVLKFIHNKDKRFLTFVANRIAIIHDGSHTSSWRYVDTGSNPADEASRGISVESLIRRPRWLTGPGFLHHTETDWPRQPEFIEPVPNEHPEVKKVCAVIITTPKKHDECLALMTQITERFSSWYKLKRCVSWILRYRSCLLDATRQRRIGTPFVINRKGSVKQLDIDEINEAEKHILRYVQGCKYADELKCLEMKSQQHNITTTRKSGIKRSSSLFKLDPIYKDGLLRVGGRIQHALIEEDSKHQIILPNAHHVTTLIIRHYHHIAGHSGRCYVLSLLRCKYWIIHGNSAVRRVLADCIDCRRRQATIGEQKMASLPPDRVKSNQPPFTSVGVDFFGPIFVKRGRSQVKRYGCIFTCMCVRAVHIEITHSLDTDSFLNCMRRFIARRGQPSVVRSDNGGSFISGNKELQKAAKAWNQEKIHNFCLQRGVRWMFNPPAASHHGGVWERCIRTVRKILNALLKEQTIDDEGLATLMCEVESIMNGRPLTTISDDPRDLNPLTPNHLLLLRSGPTLPPGIFNKHDLYSKKRWRQVQYMADQFWKRWLREYLPLLQTRQKWNQPRRNFKVGDVIMVVYENCPRNSWPLGKIVEVTAGRDSYVRRVKVLTRGTLIERPVDKCVLLEGVDSLT